MSDNRDWVQEAYEAFVKNAEGLDPTDPVKAVETYFEKNASDELKERCKAEGKTAESCWKFIMAVARKVSGKSCHIDPGAVYAMAMHYFEDVPVDWDRKKESKAEEKSAPSAETEAKPEKPAKPKKSAKAKKPKKRKGGEQGFFFDVIEEPEAESEVKE